MIFVLDRSLSRRRLMGSSAAALAVAATPRGAARAQNKARYTRYNVTSANGQKMLQSYAVAVKNLLALKPDDPHNWFRNAFTHTFDCPHGNWWFFVWHRGFLGWWEQTLRAASGNPDFAIPYWDWTQTPRIPAGMFNGALNPSDASYNPFIKDFQTFHDYLNPALTAYWNGLNPAQLQQLNVRMIPSLDLLWSQVQGDPTDGSMFATMPHARYLTAGNPNLDSSTKKMVAPNMVLSGLAPTEFAKFNSSQAPSHNSQPDQSTVFGILEGNPHNMVHNNIGGVGHIANPLNFGYMADNLSPVDPVFFLHHSNMDRLWDVWTRKQQALGLPTLPTGGDLATFENEPFLFYVDSQGKPVAQAKAGDYVNIGAFDYDYEPGFGEQVIGQSNANVAAVPSATFAGQTVRGLGSVAVPSGLLAQHAAGRLARPLVVEVTVPRPTSGAAPRAFDVLINAPPGTMTATADSPYYAGTVSFFGFMKGMTGDATFVVPLPPKLQAGSGALSVQVIPHREPGAPSPTAALRAQPAGSVLKAVTVATW